MVFLGISLPDNLSCHWDIPPIICNRPQLLPTIKPGWRLSSVFTRQALVGILWSNIDQPVERAIRSGLDFYLGVLQLMHLIPNHLSSIMIEADPALSRIVRSPHKSPWNLRFQVGRLNAFIQKFKISFEDPHPKTIQFSRRMSLSRLAPCQITSAEMEVLWHS